MSGATYEVVSRLMKAVTSRKITVPGSFKSDQGSSCISCNYKAQTGVLFPLERGFMYLHKPPIYIRFDEIDNVNFARESTKNRSFEFQVEAKTGTKYVFGTIDRSEYTSLFDFAKSHGLTIRNIGASHKELTNNPDDLSSEDDNIDHYVAGIKDDLNNQYDDSDESSTDEDFNPEAVDPEAKSGGDEEYDSDAADRSTDSEDRGSGDSAKASSPEKQQKRKKVKERKRSGGEAKEPTRKKKKTKVEGMPKRPMSSYFFFIGEKREDVKRDNPGISITETTKLLGEKWKALTADEKSPYEQKAAADKERYSRELAEFKAAGGEVPSRKKPTKKSQKEGSKPSSSKQKKPSSPAKNISKDIISNSPSSSD